MNICNIYNITLLKIYLKILNYEKKHSEPINCEFFFISGGTDHTYNGFLCFRRVLVVSTALNERPF